MPIPRKKPGQTENEFISECVSQIIDEYGQEQSIGICYNRWREDLTTQGKILSKMNQSRVCMEAPCWEGYEPYGMKEKDGRLVPNCVKIK